MNTIVEPKTARDDIDRIVDELVANPDRAGDLKKMLRHKIQEPQKISVLRAGQKEPQQSGPAATEQDDFWDNFPV